jgi:tRNA(Ile)-lysidine synthase
MRIRKKIIDFCREKKLLDSGDGVLMGLSGGADSVCLLFMLNSLREEMELTIRAIHINHGIRGEEADRDEAFCKDLCEKLDIPFEALHADIPALAKEEGLGLEEAGRKYRYDMFKERASALGLNKIAVAHHMNDCAETVLFQMIRGSRLNGLSGIRPQNDNIIRPLLCVTREEIEEVLAENGLEYVTDSTNLSSDYTRNYLRNEILPALERLRPNACRHMAETAAYMARVADFMEKRADEIYARAVEEESGRLKLKVKELKEADPLLSENVIYKSICTLAGRKKDITETFVRMVSELLEMQSGRSVDIKYGLRARRVYDSIIIEKVSAENAVDMAEGNCNNKLYTEIFEVEKGTALKFIENLGGFPKDNLKKYLDYDKLHSRFNGLREDEVVLRTLEDTDHMTLYPDGRGKKVMEVLKDLKVEADKRKTLPLAAVREEVLMIKGLRTCESYGIDENTTKILSLYILEE